MWDGIAMTILERFASLAMTILERCPGAYLIM